MLSISKLSVSVDSKKILSDISLDVNNHEIIAIIGPNGAGKSTLLKSILGLYPKYQGKILLNQNQITSLKINDKAKQMAYLSQSVSLSFNFLAEEVIEFGIYSYRKKNKNHVIKQKIKDMMQLTDTGHLIKRDYFSLSGGEKQRVQLARVLLQLQLSDFQFKLLLLDEHVSHLDLFHQHQILKLILKFAKEQNITVLMVLHDLNLVFQYADKTAILNKGKLYDFGKTSVVINEKMIKEIYQMNMIHLPEYNQAVFHSF